MPDRDYKRPPIKSRSVEVDLPVDRVQLEQMAVPWLEQVAASGQYNHVEMKQHWEFFVRSTAEGIPRPKALLTNVPRLYAEADNGLCSRSIELFPPKKQAPAYIRFTLERPTSRVTRFADLRARVAEWLPHFQQQFSLRGFGALRVVYKNTLPSETYPEFWKERGLRLAVVLNFFQNNIAPMGNFRPPFRVELNSKLEREIPTYLRTRMLGTAGQSGDFSVDFEYSSAPERPRPLDDCLSEIDSAHAIILDHFGKHFTESALRVFEQ